MGIRAASLEWRLASDCGSQRSGDKTSKVAEVRKRKEGSYETRKITYDNVGDRSDDHCCR